MKPPITCRLETGKLIDVQRNFVDTFNWLVEIAERMKGVDGISISGIASGNPQISLNLSAGDGMTIAEGVGGSKKLSVNIEAGDGIRIESGDGGALKIVNTREKGGGEINFRAAQGCNLTFDKETSEEGVDTWTVGVYWTQS